MRMLGFMFLASMVGAALMALGVVLGAIISRNERRETHDHVGTGKGVEKRGRAA